jgi:RNA polymerase sigma-70 factor, ECF subfamily
VIDAAGQSSPLLPFDAAALVRHRALVARMAQGDAEALQLLFLEFSPLVNGIVRRILEDPEEARETVQDTFIKAWRSAGAFQPDRGEVVAWLVFIARHAAIDRVRKGARRRRLYAAFQREATTPTVAPTSRFELREDISQRLDALPAAQRQALELAFFDGCTQAQIAAVMQTSIGNVKNHLRRGIQKLRHLSHWS